MGRKTSIVLLFSFALNILLVLQFARIWRTVQGGVGLIDEQLGMEASHALRTLPLRYYDSSCVVRSSTNDLDCCVSFSDGSFPLVFARCPDNLLRNADEKGQKRCFVRYGDMEMGWRRDAGGRCLGLSVNINGRCWEDANGDGDWRETTDPASGHADVCK